MTQASAPVNSGIPTRADFLVVGGGIVGITIALELSRRFPKQKIHVIEKESSLAQHASGRNSGILHAGFYYSADSLKARFCREGNRILTAYCEERGLRINRCGKLVVAANEAEVSGIDELLRRGKVNGISLESVTEEEARKIEPRAHTVGKAIFSPTTSAVDPLAVSLSLASDAAAKGVTFSFGARYIGRENGRVRTSAGEMSCGHVINAAGLYADKIARDFGFAEHYRILPFKGVYLYADEGETIRTNIYPVPNLANPFLGVHFTVTTGGRTKIGPTAIPALWREQYGWTRGFRAGEFAQIVSREIELLVRNDFNFRSLAFTEMKKYRRKALVKLAARMVPDVDARRYNHWGKPGIRAQLIDTRTRALTTDFLIEGDGRSTHVLNAVSPGFTASVPFAAHVVNEVARSLGEGADAAQSLESSALGAP